ncbi:hypothetical protein SDC9_159704 [bioreactor metagenome]|uniref:Uncharacterized protein n=1 Tax=bioreactor metagenome TaxID=1076179 RepID=A0A645FFK9_9ZZZZ
MRRRGPRCARHQADPLPGQRRFAGGRHARPRGGARQAGHGDRRAQGALRRRQQHRLGAPSGRGRRPCSLRHFRVENSWQGAADRAPRRGSDPALCASVHRQLQRQDRATLYRHEHFQLRSGAVRRDFGAVQYHDRIRHAGNPVAADRRRAVRPPAALPEPDRP